jgi:ATP-binding cassette, subfamily F, member 3
MIQLADIKVSFGERTLFDGVTWHLDTGDRVAVVGPNGSGKTTLFKVALGLLTPDSGKRLVSRSARPGYLPQEDSSPSGRTVLAEALTAFPNRDSLVEEMESLGHELETLAKDDPELPALLGRYGSLQKRFEQENGYHHEHLAKEVLSGLGFAPEEFGKPVSAMSGGWQMRVALAKLLLASPTHLFLDEPTNHLDIESMAWLEDYLSHFPGAVILVSHDRYFLDRMARKTCEISGGKLLEYHTNYTGYLAEKEQRKEALINQAKRQGERVAQLERFIERFRAKNTKATQVKSKEKMLEKMERVVIPGEEKRIRFHFPPAPPCGRKMLELADAGKAYGDKRVFSGIGLLVERGQKIAMVGVNGAGKSTLLRLLAGTEAPTEGKRTAYPRVEIAYFAQHTTDMLNPENTVQEEMQSASPDELRPRLRTLLGSFLFTGDDVFKKVSVLSGGEKARLALAKTLLQPANLLIMDEPTNHLDLAGKEVLEQALLDYEGSLVIVTHDRYLMNRVAEITWEMENGRFITYPGNYDLYLWRKARLVEEEAPPDVLPKTRDEEKERKRREALERAEKYKHKKALLTLEKEIEAKEARKKEVEGLLADPKIYADGEQARALVLEYQRVRDELDALYEVYEEKERLIAH